MYIRYNNSSNLGQNPSQNRQQNSGQMRQGCNDRRPQNRHNTTPERHEKPPCREHDKSTKNEHVFKNPLTFLPKEIYNPKTHKFFGKISADDILLMGLILLVLDSGCDDDLILALALGYILLSDYFDFGNILF